jgi:hypothetical protein
LLSDFVDKPIIILSMESDYYERRTDKGILSLNRNKDCPSYWDWRLNGKLIHSNYTDPNQAAFDASNHDFGTSELDELFQSVYVPSNLQDWRTSPSIYRKDSKPVETANRL